MRLYKVTNHTYSLAIWLRADVGGDAPTVEKEPWNEDVLRLQEYLMSFPEVEEFESKVLQARFADAADLPARVLHTLLKEGAGAAYDLIKDYEIFSAPTIELKEMVMKFESLDAAAGKGKGGKEAKGGKKPKPKTPPKGGAAKYVMQNPPTFLWVQF